MSPRLEAGRRVGRVCLQVAQARMHDSRLHRGSSLPILRVRWGLSLVRTAGPGETSYILCTLAAPIVGPFVPLWTCVYHNGYEFDCSFTHFFEAEALWRQ
ncbi:hypothetical protein AVEN_198934-1 [Araneus ventricosus]|uniref:Uncharacterized protein n=1 Tax=Araneus ventricosus TaxID=182803 RepID=A0A4Y2IB41_ARAVE|nr:hypothetical protein AVEN_198934-1 [Araneus ventricosus]